MQSVHEGVTYNCEHCDYTAKQKSDLLQHVQSLYEGVTYSCEHCDHKSIQKANFSNMCDLYTKELLLFVSIVITKQITKELLAAI